MEVAPEQETDYREAMRGFKLAYIGQVTDSTRLEIYGLAGRKILVESLKELKEAWQKPLRW